MQPVCGGMPLDAAFPREARVEDILYLSVLWRPGQWDLIQM